MQIEEENSNGMRWVWLALVCLLIPGFLTVGPGMLPRVKSIEGRPLEPFPPPPRSIGEWHRWPRKLEAFLTDRFPGRRVMIQTNSRARSAMKMSSTSKAIVGQNGWLFLSGTDRIDEKQRGVVQMTLSRREAWVSEYLELKMALEAHDCQLYLIVVPNKHSIYPEFLPPWWGRSGESLTGQIVATLGEAGVPDVIDLRPVLAEARQTEKVYNRLDTHWNDLGAFRAYEAIMDALDPSLASFRLNEEELQVSQEKVSGDLARISGRPDLFEESPFIEVVVDRRISHDPIREDYGWSVVSSLEQAPRAIILCDSFTERYLHKFLEPSFSSSLFLFHRKMQFVEEELIQREKPDLMLIIMVERMLEPWWKLDFVPLPTQDSTDPSYSASS